MFNEACQSTRISQMTKFHLDKFAQPIYQTSDEMSSS